MARKLATGDVYDIDTLTHAGWTDGDGTGTDGYSCWDYFDGEGRYLGPDPHGIEPMFADVETGAPTAYTLTIRDDQCCETFEFDEQPTAKEIAAQCREWVEGGDWGDSGAAITVRWKLTDSDGDEIDTGSDVIDVEPDHDALIAAAGGDTDCEHEWTSEGEGGLDENPGVWSVGGTAMLFVSHCKHCSLRRREHHTGSQRNPGEYDTVEYSLPESVDQE